MENEVMQIIVYAGNARSLAMQSIRASKQGERLEAGRLMTEAESNLKEAHHTHAKILSAASDEQTQIDLTLFMVHGEDHLMSAITTIDLAKEFKDVHEELKELKECIQLMKEGEKA
ncbi:PTS lactose/cellobiose transporter subunit IIA [Enterococcus sp. BWM-S5]|uniref:PTS lactose/cellobiose transporter subunit IIA n=1 Tax=Enterococcus larvae TaxID=2794352 RepID=A0ABS4CI45_9ENTE|nr:PTS lactose/cellobiose transporter subunit IIA [Enterococcus larvae]MBP1046308.1 PTS lactose/cellobiose transporter subunit IIA [Enterococcus larvae]